MNDLHITHLISFLQQATNTQWSYTDDEDKECWYGETYTHIEPDLLLAMVEPLMIDGWVLTYEKHPSPFQTMWFYQLEEEE